MPLEVVLTGPQDDFVFAEEQFPAMVAGFGAGKSHAAIWRTLRLKFAYRQQNVAYYLPTYDLVSRMAFPRIGEALDQMEVRHKPNKNDNVIEIPDAGATHCRPRRRAKCGTR